MRFMQPLYEKNQFTSIGVTRTTKFGKFSLDLAIFPLKNIETAEFRNKIEIDESERCEIQEI